MDVAEILALLAASLFVGPWLLARRLANPNRGNVSRG